MIRSKMLSIFVLLGFFFTAPGETKGWDQLFITSDQCLACHNALFTESGMDVSIGSNWQSSMMAHSSKDPYWQASVRRESLNHPSAKESIEDECSACHMPMSRYSAKEGGLKGEVFIHLPFLHIRSQDGRLAEDGVSCSMCHQIQSEMLGKEESFTAGFVIDTETPMGERQAFGPYEIDQGRTRIMQSASQMVPQKGMHVQNSDLCASCHTLYTHSLGPNGEIVGELPEQVPYLEWRHSAYYEVQNCQSCHMPQLQEPMEISGVLGQPREAFSRHVFRGGNFLMPKIFNRNRTELVIKTSGADLMQASRETMNNLQKNAARVSILKTKRNEDHLDIDIEISNLAGHKLPTAYPSRRAWIHLKVSKGNGELVFESGAFNPDGSIEGNDNDLDKTRYEPHYNQIDKPEQVQIYEAIMVNPEEKVTTGLLEAVRFIKDNRILPDGFNKADANEDIAVRGAARQDKDFKGMSDLIRYKIPVDAGERNFKIRVSLWYQPIGFRWSQNLKQQQAEEIDRFVSYFNAMSENSGITMASDSTQLK